MYSGLACRGICSTAVAADVSDVLADASDSIERFIDVHDLEVMS